MVNQTPISDTIRPISPIAMPTVIPPVGITSLGPPIESVESVLGLPKKGLELVKEGVDVAGKIYNFSHTAYVDLVPCFSLQLSHILTTDDHKPTYNVKTRNCSNHPEHIIRLCSILGTFV